MGILDGQKVARHIRRKLRCDIADLKAEGIIPGLAVIIVGDDPASQSYVTSKTKIANRLGLKSLKYELPYETTEDELLEVIDKLNKDDSIDGILVQLPLPAHIDSGKVLYKIDVDKDVDGFHPMNIGRMFIGEDTLLPCTPHGVIQILKAYDIRLSGKKVVIIGRSNIVGKPLSMMFLHENATVTTCHSKTVNLKEVSKSADILVVATGRAKFIDSEYVKPGAVVIDVGINRVDGRIVGDVDFDDVKELASYITPVPGGIGPMTIVMLMYNTIKSAKNRRKK